MPLKACYLNNHKINKLQKNRIKGDSREDRVTSLQQKTNLTRFYVG